MIEELLTLPLDTIHPHPHNVRRDATPDAELIASIEAQGILQPIGVVADPANPGEWLLIAGHRRLAAAQVACLTDVPAVNLAHLTTEAQQIETMLVENGRRQDLTPAEEAVGYQQLTLLGMTVGEIAERTGRSRTTVDARLKIAGLPPAALEAVHSHQITLEQADLLSRLQETRPDLYDELEESISTDSFGWRLRSAVDRMQTALKHATLRAVIEALDLPEVDEPLSYGTADEVVLEHVQAGTRTADCWYRGTNRGDYNARPRLYRYHAGKNPDGGGELTPEEQARQDESTRIAAERQREADERQAAARERLLADQLRMENAAAAAAPRWDKSTVGHLRVGVVGLILQADWYGYFEMVVAAAAAAGINNIPDSDTDYDECVTALVRKTLTATPATLTHLLLATLDVLARHQFNEHTDLTSTLIAFQTAYWDAHRARGYAFPDRDQADIDDFTRRVAEAQDTTDPDKGVRN